MQGREAAAQAVKSRSGAKTSAVKSARGGDELRFQSDDAPGLKIHPQTVLVISLVYVGIVVVLHIWGKLRGDGAQVQQDL